VFEYRITKYDPDFRACDGGYLLEEWTSVSDIGQELGGRILTRAEYDRVESAYVAAALAFLEQAGVETLVVNGLENHQELALYVGVPREVPEAELLAQSLGLFVESFDSPHHPEDEEEDEDEG